MKHKETVETVKTGSKEAKEQEVEQQNHMILEKQVEFQKYKGIETQKQKAVKQEKQKKRYKHI